jgi:excisionase family DNA binding protein
MHLQASADRQAYPLNEVAQQLGGISIRSVYNLIYANKLRAVHIGGRRVVLRDDLQAFLAGFKREAA